VIHDYMDVVRPILTREGKTGHFLSCVNLLQLNHLHTL